MTDKTSNQYFKLTRDVLQKDEDTNDTFNIDTKKTDTQTRHHIW